MMVNHHGGVVLVKRFHLRLFGQQSWTSQDFKTGRANWQDKDKLGKGSLTCAGNRLYLRPEDKPGTVALIESFTRRLQGAWPVRAAAPQRHAKLVPSVVATGNYICAIRMSCCVMTSEVMLLPFLP